MTRMISILSAVALLSSLPACHVGSVPPGAGSDPDASSPGTPDSGIGQPLPADAAPGSPDAAVAVVTPEEALRMFGACMLLADWEAANLGQMSLMRDNNQSLCSGCHSGGVGNMYITATSADNFLRAKSYPPILNFVTVTVPPGSPPSFAVSAGIPSAGQAGSGHPSLYTLPAPVLAGLTSFFQATQAHYQAGTCQAP